MVGESHVAVTGHVEEGVVEYLAASYVDHGIFGVEFHLLVGVAEGDEVGERGGVGIPVAAAIVFEQGNLSLGECRLYAKAGGKGQGCEETKENFMGGHVALCVSTG